jgi:hypothetical protein
LRRLFREKTIRRTLRPKAISNHLLLAVNRQFCQAGLVISTVYKQLIFIPRAIALGSVEHNLFPNIRRYLFPRVQVRQFFLYSLFSFKHSEKWAHESWMSGLRIRDVEHLKVRHGQLGPCPINEMRTIRILDYLHY